MAKKKPTTGKPWEAVNIRSDDGTRQAIEELVKLLEVEKGVPVGIYTAVRIAVVEAVERRAKK